MYRNYYAFDACEDEWFCLGVLPHVHGRLAWFDDGGPLDWLAL